MKTLESNLIIRRYPKSENRSLRPSSSADELILDHITKEQTSLTNVLLINDRFGYLACTLSNHSPISLINYKSQEKALRQNLIANQIPIVEENIIFPFQSITTEVETVLMKAPKSLDLFELQLNEINKIISDKGTVVCGFMTRHFSKQMLEIAGKYFDSVEQSLAQKKARLLILKGKKSIGEQTITHNVQLEDGTVIKQFYGVFSANHVDIATQFLLDNITIDKNLESILDLASGNGVIAHHVRQHNKMAELHLVDDNYLAVESGKLNVSDDKTYHHFSDCLENFTPKFFDLVVSNPPFHFEHETNIEISLNLFKEVKKCLKPEGHFILVANQHLNYKTHLTKLFAVVNTIAENERFVIYDCSK